MGRKKGLSKDKVSGILRALIEHSEGIWIRAIARECKIDPKTVKYYIDGPLRPLVDDTSLGNSKKPHMRVVRLKPYVLQQIEEGKDINQILKLAKLMNQLE